MKKSVFSSVFVFAVGLSFLPSSPALGQTKKARTVKRAATPTPTATPDVFNAETKTVTEPVVVEPAVASPSVPSKPTVVRQAEPHVTIKPVEGPTLLHPYGAGITIGLGFPAPFKYGLLANYQQSTKLTWEAAYLAGGLSFGVGPISFGGFKENLISVNARYSPWTNSFSWILGLARHAYRVNLGNEIVGRLNGGPGTIDILAVETLALQVGVGNRWNLAENFWIGVDWLVLTLPVTTLSSESPALQAYTNQSDLRLVEDALSSLRRIPTFNLMKTSIGYSF